MILGCMLRGHQQPTVGIDGRLFIESVGIIHGERGLNIRVALHGVTEKCRVVRLMSHARLLRQGSAS
jgi:hypothetical protein